MEVRNLCAGQPAKEALGGITLQRSISSIPSIKAEPAAADDSVQVSIDSAPAPQESPNPRFKLNEAINLVNVTSGAAGTLRHMVKSIDGMVSQAEDAKVSPSRLSVLESEANSLVGEIKRVAQGTSVNGVRPLAGDKVVLELKEQFGRQLEFIFPVHAKEGFGLSDLSLARKESIIETRTKVAVAWRQIEELTNAIEANAGAVRSVAASLEVAAQNSEAADASPRDLEKALQLAESTSLSISKNPQSAIESAGSLQKNGG